MKINKLIGVMLIFSCIIMLNGVRKISIKLILLHIFDILIQLLLLLVMKKKKKTLMKELYILKIY